MQKASYLFDSNLIDKPRVYACIDSRATSTARFRFEFEVYKFLLAFFGLIKNADSKNCTDICIQNKTQMKVSFYYSALCNYISLVFNFNTRIKIEISQTMFTSFLQHVSAHEYS
jgi:hypothetical protein